MFVLDTNIISETFKPRPDPDVAMWMEAVPASAAYVAALSKAELLVGLASMPDGRRKLALGDVIGVLFSKWLKTPILSSGAGKPSFMLKRFPAGVGRGGLSASSTRR